MQHGVRITTSGQSANVSPLGGASEDVVLDSASARDLDLFFTRVPLTEREPVRRPVALWRGGKRFVADVEVHHDGEMWHLVLGDERPDDAAPDRPEAVDPRLDDLSTPVWVTDGDRLARWFNRAWCAFVGRPLADELGWGWMQHVPPDDLNELMQAYEAASIAGTGFDYRGRILDANDRLWWSRVRAVPRVGADGLNGFLGICAIVGPVDAAAAPATGAIAALLPPVVADDGMALDAVQRLERIETTLEVSRPADPIEASLLRRLTSQWVKQHDWLVARHDDVVLAIGEAMANAVVHAYRFERGVVELRCDVADGVATFRVRDWGVWEMPTGSPESRGIVIMRALADDFEMHHFGEGTEIVLRYRR